MTSNSKPKPRKNNARSGHLLVSNTIFYYTSEKMVTVIKNTSALKKCFIAKKILFFCQNFVHVKLFNHS